MLSFNDAREHARQCGYVLDGIDAVPLHRVLSRANSGKGAWSAVDILHPENLSVVVIPAGYWIDAKEIDALTAIGIDYVILED